MTIVFFYPSHIVGGAEFLITRLTEYLLPHHQCYIVDFENGIYKTLNPNLSRDIFIKYEKDFKIPIDAYIMTYPSELKTLSDNIHISNNCNKILLWGVHGDNFQNLIPLKHFLPNFIKKYFLDSWMIETIMLLHKKKSLIVMDGGILERYKILYNIDISLPFCPIPITVKDNLPRVARSTNPIKCVWLGRLSSEKVYSLKKILEDINFLKHITVEFDIIGSGDYEYIIREMPIKNHLTINFLGTITDGINDRLQNYNICFAMGTSVLESAKLGIPSILVDASYTELPENYQYRWIFDSKEFVLGYILPTEKIHSHDLTMEKIFSFLQDSTKIEDVGRQCYEYTKKYHSLESITDQLMIYLQQSELTIDELRKFKILNTILHTIFYTLRKLKHTWNIFKKITNNK